MNLTNFNGFSSEQLPKYLVIGVVIYFFYQHYSKLRMRTIRRRQFLNMGPEELLADTIRILKLKEAGDPNWDDFYGHRRLPTPYYTEHELRFDSNTDDIKVANLLQERISSGIYRENDYYFLRGRYEMGIGDSDGTDGESS